MRSPAGATANLDLREIIPGAVFVGIGAYFLVNSLFFISTRSAGVGPTTFPTLVSLPLIGIGLAILVRGLRQTTRTFTFLSWRKLALLLAAPIIFGATTRGLGMLPALILCIGCASFAEMRLPWLRRLIVVAAITVLCLAIFYYGLSLPYPLVGPWLLP